MYTALAVKTEKSLISNGFLLMLQQDIGYLLMHSDTFKMAVPTTSHDILRRATMCVCACSDQNNNTVFMTDYGPD